MTVASPALTAPETSPTPPPRLVPALIGRPDNASLAWVPCPEWCRIDHSIDRQVAVEDVWHSGEYVDLEMPHQDGAKLLAFFRLAMEPYSDDAGKRRVFVFAEDGSDCYFIDREQVGEFCDKAIVQLERLRAMARSTAG